MLDKQVETGTVQALTAFNLPRQKGEIDFVTHIAEMIQHHVGATEAGCFAGHALVMTVLDKNSLVQRMNISRYLRELLLVFRAKQNVTPVIEVMPYISDDVDNDQWLSLLIEIIMPFLRTENVFKVVYGLK